MNKTELAKDMKQFTGAAFITRDELRRFLGVKDPHSVDELLHGLLRFKKRYFISDVADRVIQQMNVKN